MGEVAAVAEVRDGLANPIPSTMNSVSASEERSPLIG